MKNIRFIRHGLLEEPFSNYDNLTFEQLGELARVEITPDIHTKKNNPLIEKISPKELSKYDLILASRSNRTKQTAALINSRISKKIKTKSSKYLDEIYFDPSILTTEKLFKKNQMDVIRVSLFRGMISGKGSDQIREIISRIKKLEKKLKSLKEQNIICVTHGFYMRVLILYFLDHLKDPAEITQEHLKKVTNYYYLDGFEIEL